MKDYEDLRSKYTKLQEENTSLIDLTELISRDEAAQVTEKWSSARSATKEEGAMSIISHCFFLLHLFFKNCTIN